jgi:hypothetical protein
MAWTRPEYSRSQMDRFGKTYMDPNASPEDREIALSAINNWRSSHSFPLNTFQINLRRVANRLDDYPTVAQRIKRLPSIRHKLERFPGMKLSRMQDLGGARAVVSTVGTVGEVVHFYLHETQMKHKLAREPNDYILQPKDSGYRGVHIVYNYASDKSTQWNGLSIELQIRSRQQHAWATAVETVGTFTRQALKSSWGEDEWLRFFALMSSAIAMREGTPLVPNTPTHPSALAKELRQYVTRLRVIERLTSYGQALDIVEVAPKGAGFFLLELDTAANTLLARAYTSAAMATEQYAAVERAIEGAPTKDAVLVSVDSLAALRQAYPNYFLDTEEFVSAVRDAIA